MTDVRHPAEIVSQTTRPTLDAQGHRALAVTSRVRLLDVLRQAPEPVGVVDLAAAVGLHANTVRSHLDVLIDAGLVTRIDEAPTRPGRPRALFTVAEDGPPGEGERHYRLLAEILASHLASSTTEPAATATQAGREWGRYLADRPAPFARAGQAQATDALVRLLGDLDFQPELSDDRQQVALHHCPFREVAERHQDVVCGVHLGLMQGLLTELRAPLTATRLEPFVQPRLCMIDLGPVPVRAS